MSSDRKFTRSKESIQKGEMREKEQQEMINEDGETETRQEVKRDEEKYKEGTGEQENEREEKQNNKKGQDEKKGTRS